MDLAARLVWARNVARNSLTDHGERIEEAAKEAGPGSAWARYEGPDPSVTHRRPRAAALHDPSPRRAGQVVRAFQQGVMSRSSARIRLGLRPRGVTVQRPIGGGDLEAMANVPWFRTATEINSAHRAGLIHGFEAAMLLSEIREGWGSWLAWHARRAVVGVLIGGSRLASSSPRRSRRRGRLSAKLRGVTYTLIAVGVFLALQHLGMIR